MDDKGKEEVVDTVFGLGEIRDLDIGRNIQKISEESPGVKAQGQNREGTLKILEEYFRNPR